MPSICETIGNFYTGLASPSPRSSPSTFNMLIFVKEDLSRNAPSFTENIVAEDFCALSPRRTKQWVCGIWKVDQGNSMQTLVHSNVHVCTTTTEYGYVSCVQCNYSIQYHQCDPMDLTYVLQQCVGCSALLQWPHMLALTGGHVALPMDRVDPKYQSRDNCSTCHFHAFHTVYI